MAKATTEDSSPTASPPVAGVAKGAYYALIVLLLINVVNYTDRQILSILMEPIKLELNLNDSQLGLLSGIAFALFYAVVGIPIARLADRVSRRNIIAASVVAWSALTAVCGMAQSFSQLLLARIGVAVGEAGSAPPSHSIISDLFPHGRRSTALAILSAGAPLGVLFGLAAGGILNQLFNWRIAFMAVGVPGLILAVLLMLTVREPIRERPVESAADRQSTWAVIRHLWAIRSFRNMAYAATLQAFAAYGLTQWNPTFFVRTFHIGTAQLGLSLGLIGGIASAVGTIVLGNLADRFGRRDVRWYAWMPAIEIALSIPFYFAVYFAPSFTVALIALIIPSMLTNAFAAPTYATVQSVVPPQMRSTASAFLLLIMAVIGMGLGPQAIGLLSDAYVPAAGPESLRWAMVSLVVIKVLAAWRYYAAAKGLKPDFEAAGIRT